jgi:hypothetical protein
VVIGKIGQPCAFCGIWGWKIVIAWQLAKYSGLLGTILLSSFGVTRDVSNRFSRIQTLAGLLSNEIDKAQG